jgi:2-polyprenyl-6-methoxyphenol hydroxylase-like FAD-dependent oxidoreductase
MAKLGGTAVVAGRSMAGLAAAAALAKHFERILIVDKDQIPAGPEPRLGVGQGHHVHNLLKGGELSIEKLLPGTCAGLMTEGAVPMRAGIDMRISDHGQLLPKRDLGYDNISASRPLIEHVVSQRLMRETNVELRSATSLEDLVFSDAGRVCGALLQTSGNAPDLVDADLVVDCTGHLSKAKDFLAAREGAAAPGFKINIGISYTSAVFAAPSEAAGGYKGFAILPSPPNKRGAFASLIEDGKWLFSLHTRFEKALPATQQEMIAFASEIETPDAVDFLKQARIETPIRSYRKLEAAWRRFDKQASFPDGFLVLGDSMTSFNPIFGQGMSTAWLQAVALEKLLSARADGQRGLDGLARDYLPEAAQISREAWNGSTLVDSAYPEVTGDMRPGTKQAVLYLRTLRTLLADDPELHADYIGVGQLTTPGAALMRPDRMQRAMAAMAKLPP